MASDQHQMSGGSAPAAHDEPAVQQSQGATEDVELHNLNKNGSVDDDRAPAIPPKDAAPIAGNSDQSDEITEARRSPKGKERAEIPPAPIEKMDPLAIGNAEPVPAAGSNVSPASDEPVCNITLLLPTGARHPYRLDEKYLTKRNVEVPDLTEDGKKDPFSISIYKLKELILREWRDDWEVRPTSPTSIRLIHFGKLLEDKEQLKSM
jgi:hypothetical protein